MVVRLYSFTKRKNSTAKPSSGGDSYNCTLINPCGVLNPSIRLNTSDDVYTYNYAYIPEFNRYYWVNEWTWDGGFWTVSLSSDPLASWSDDIKNSEQYVTRAAAQRNGDVVDAFYPTTAAITKVVTPVGFRFNTPLSAGIYVVGIVGYNPSASSMGMITYYYMTSTGFNNLGRVLFQSSDWLEMEQGTDIPMVKSEFNPIQYITSCTWFPFTEGAGVRTESIKLGWWNVDIGGGVFTLGSKTAEFSQSITIPTHPLQPTRGYYLNLPPYARYTLQAGPFGEIPLDGTFFVKDANLNMNISVDLISGDAVLFISSNSTASGSFRIARCAMGVPISIAQLKPQFFQSALTALGSGQGMALAAAGGDMTGLIMSGMSTMRSAFDSILPQVSTGGSNGSMADTTLPFALVSQFFGLVDEDPEHVGSPVCRRLRLGSLPGFVLVGGADVELDAFSTEIDSIKSYLEGGVYIE